MASGRGESKKHSSSDGDESCSVIGGELENSCIMTGGNAVKMLSECHICMEILVSPIYQCQRGHIICNTCQPKLTKCPSCEAPVGLIRNLALELILENVSFSCNRYPKGCKEFSKIQDLEKHHEECEFRPLKCHLSDMENCNGTFLSLTETLGHLQKTHKLRTVKSEEGQPNVFESGEHLYLSEEGNSKRTTLEGELYRFDENYFVSLIRTQGALIYFGFYLIGPKSDASKYSVKIAVQNNALKDAIFKNETTTTFTSIRDFQEVWEDWKLPHEYIVHEDVLRRDSKIFLGGQNDVEKEPYNWAIVYTINKN